MGAKDKQLHEDHEDSTDYVDDILSIERQLKSEFGHMLDSELSQLEVLTKFTESVAAKLKQHYQDVFPKICNNCKTIYETREDYLNATKVLGPTSTVFDAVGLQEYRNCECGSTLVIWTQERRDNTEYGIARRKLFGLCLEKMKKISDKPERELMAQLRQLFSGVSS